jgi:glutamate carboxypeptidase
MPPWKSRRAAAIDLLKEIVNIDSGTGDIAGQQPRAGGADASHLTALGAEGAPRARRGPRPARQSGGDAFKGTGKGRVLLIAHVDTVFGPGVAAKRPFRVEGARAYGPGVSDEKAGVVNAVMALKVLRDVGFQNFATLTLLLETSEERGSPGTQNLIRTLAREHDVEFNLEPGDPPDNLTVWRKGSARIHIRVKGRAAHAGVAPQDGRNAALELIHQITSLAKDFPTTGDGTTVNLTVMRAGERTNIIPDTAEAIYSARYRQPAGPGRHRRPLPRRRQGHQRAGHQRRNLSGFRPAPADPERRCQRAGRPRPRHLCRTGQDHRRVRQWRRLGIGGRAVRRHAGAGRAGLGRRRLPHRQ